MSDSLTSHPSTRTSGSAAAGPDVSTWPQAITAKPPNAARRVIGLSPRGGCVLDAEEGVVRWFTAMDFRFANVVPHHMRALLHFNTSLHAARREAALARSHTAS
jgi:hypothetical protein